jgi:hypothetical protein
MLIFPLGNDHPQVAFCKDETIYPLREVTMRGYLIA